MAMITAAAGGGNWSVGGTWVGGVAPGTNDDVVLASTSGNVTLDASTAVRSLNATGYTGTLALASFTLTVNGTGNIVNLTNTTTYTANTATIALTGANAQFNTAGTPNLNGLSVVITGGGSAIVGSGTFKDITRTGTASKTDVTTISNLTCTGTLTVNGNSATNRVLVQGASSPGTTRTLTCAAVSFSNVDFRDIIGAGAANWNLAAITGGSGNCGGNSNITFTTAAAQTWSGTSGGNWSANAWTSRVPLPQDDVVIASAFSASQTITLDMPRLGRNIDFTGTTGNPVLGTSSVNLTLYGSLSLVAGMTATGTQSITFEGRGSHTVRTAGVTLLGAFIINSVGGVYTLADALTVSNGCTLSNGTFDTNGYTVTTANFTSTGTGTRVLRLGATTWNLTSTSASSVWNVSNT